MTEPHFLESVLYSSLNFLPHAILAVYALERRFRFGRGLTLLFFLLLAAAQAVLGAMCLRSGFHMGIASLISVALLTLLYCFAVKAHPGKLLFLVLFFTNTANFTVILGKCFEGIFLGHEQAKILYSLPSCLFLAIAHLFSTLPLFFYIRSHIHNVIDRQYGKKAWTYLWLIPAIFYLVWFNHLYEDGDSALDVSLHPQHTLFLFFITLGSVLVYHTVIHMLLEQEKNLQLQESSHQLAVQNLQYENLKDRINEARHAKHDIRHHITVMDGYLQRGEYEKLQSYLNGYKRSLPDDSSIVFCKNYAVNTLLLYFAQQAKNQGIDYDVVVADIPEDLRLPEDVVSVVLGNLLENALEACAQLTDGQKKITIRGKASDDSIFFKIENSYNGEVKKDKNGLYLSTKHEGRGIGLASVRAIIKQYDGIVEIDDQNGLFSVSVFSGIPQPKQPQ